jgi:hypothetical protein
MTNKQLEQVNVKIAKKIGWKRFRKERLPDPLFGEARMTGLAPGNMRNQFVPTFTSNLAYAMQLVDWATERDFNFQLVKYGKYVGDFHYKATFEYIGEQKAWDTATLPSMAICMAFLKIKE